MVFSTGPSWSNAEKNMEFPGLRVVLWKQQSLAGSVQAPRDFSNSIQIVTSLIFSLLFSAQKALSARCKKRAGSIRFCKFTRHAFSFNCHGISPLTKDMPLLISKSFLSPFLHGAQIFCERAPFASNKAPVPGQPGWACPAFQPSCGGPMVHPLITWVLRRRTLWRSLGTTYIHCYI